MINSKFKGNDFKIRLTIIGLFLSCFVNAQTPAFNWINIQPTGDSTGTTDILSINFITDLVGYALATAPNGSDRKLMKTTDGGCHWKKIVVLSDEIFHSYFFNEQLGFLSQSDGVTLPDNIYRTTDGGLSWTMIALPGYAFAPVDMFFTSTSRGCFVNQDGEIYTTYNGGLSWTMANSPNQCCSNFNFSLYFVNQNVGFMAGINGAIFKTTNGGTYWTQQNSTSSYLSFASIFFPTPAVGYAAGADSVGEIFKSTDAGLHWNKIYSDLNWFESIWFTSKDTGYVLCDNGKLYKTDNGGSTFTSTVLSTTTDFYAAHYIRFMSNGAAFIAGENGLFKHPIMPIPNFTSSDTIVCSGNTITLSNLSQHAGIFSWYDNGLAFSNQSSPDYTIQDAGIHTLTMEANSCTLLDSSTLNIHVLPVPSRPIVVSNTDTITSTTPLLFCQDDSVALSALGIYSAYNWICNTATSSLPSIYISNTDTLVLKVTGSNGCSSYSDSLYLKRKPKSVSVFDFSIHKMDVHFNNQSLYASNYNWLLGDNTTATSPAPLHQYAPGNYQVLLITSNDCGADTLVKNVSITLTNQLYPNPTNGLLSIEINDRIDNNSKFQLFDASGVLVDEQSIRSNIIKYDAIYLSKGVYFLRISTSERALMYKFIKK